MKFLCLISGFREVAENLFKMSRNSLVFCMVSYFKMSLDNVKEKKETVVSDINYTLKHEYLRKFFKGL